MSKKQMPTLLVASLFCSISPASIVLAQSDELRCPERNSLVEGKQDCDDQNANRKLSVDRMVTNSVSSDANSASNSNATNDNDSASSSDSTAPGNDGGSDADVSDDGDHDNGHGNDPDHDDPSNPGQGGGNHGAGK